MRSGEDHAVYGMGTEAILVYGGRGGIEGGRGGRGGVVGAVWAVVCGRLGSKKMRIRRTGRCRSKTWPGAGVRVGGRIGNAVGVEGTNYYCYCRCYVGAGDSSGDSATAAQRAGWLDCTGRRELLMQS